MVGTGGKQTGFAWFNYAVVSPVPVVGRVNINTASERLLSSLPGISPALAKNIFEGCDANGKKSLKPYRFVGDVLKVHGMSPEIFEKCVNLLAVDSSVFTVEVDAQIFKERAIDAGKQINKDSIIAERKKRFVLIIGKNGENNFKIRKIENYPVNP